MLLYINNMFVDAKDSVVQSLACFVCYDSSLKVIEGLCPRL